jgi:hypothetical protein
MTTFPAQDWVNANIKDKSLEKLLLNTAEQSNVWWNKEVIGIGGQLTGDLTLENYPNLKEIEIESHQLTSLTLINCPKLESLKVRDNGLTKLELSKVNGDKQNNLKEIIASDNNLTSLDLTNCQQVKELLISDNPNLRELKNWNHKVIDNFNKVNTQVDLSSEEKQLIAKNDALFNIIKGVNQMGQTHELVLTEPIFTPKQNEEALKRLLIRTRDRWTEYFESEELDQVLAKKYPLLHVSFKDPKTREKGEQILILINGVIEKNYTYKQLLKEWNGDEDENKPYNPVNDYDLALLAFISHLRAFKPLSLLWQGKPLTEPIFYDFIHNN